MKSRIANYSQAIRLTGIMVIMLASTLAGCTAAALGKPSLALEVQSAVSSGSVNVYLHDGVAILSGRVESTYDSLAAERAAARYPGVVQVRNRIYVVGAVR